MKLSIQHCEDILKLRKITHIEEVNDSVNASLTS